MSATPSAEAVAQVRKFNQSNLDLYAFVHSEAGQRQRAAQGLRQAPTIRSATEAEIMEIAAQLDAGGILNPRLWIETFTVRQAAEVVSFQRAA